MLPLLRTTTCLQLRSTGGRPSRSIAALSILQQCEAASDIEWDDRVDFQSRFSPEEKGWQVKVEWKPSKYGTGVFSCEDIPQHTVLRVGEIGRNLLGFENPDDLVAFAGEEPAKWRYLQDYLWGLYTEADERGYQLSSSSSMWVGMWIPGNGLNHSTEPNTMYRDFGAGRLNLVALTDITAGDELFDDYRRHGIAPEWLKEFASSKGLSLNFADCNDFVDL